MSVAVASLLFAYDAHFFPTIVDILHNLYTYYRMILYKYVMHVCFCAQRLLQ